jgi:hypothetical protein
MLNRQQEALTMSILDPEAAQLLRRAIQLGNPGRTTVADLRMAVDHPVPLELPPARLRGDAPLANLLRRAMDLAKERDVELVSRADLLEALLESEAKEAGLDLERLRFVRYCIGRTNGEAAPARRQIGASVGAPQPGPRSHPSP